MESKIVMNDDVEQCNQQTKEIESSEKEIRKIFKDGLLFGKLNAAVSIRLKRVFQST
ncbi:MAG: hypothetical protein E6X87_16975 [Lachnospiraceae bacterium]|nr:hypothetical protein [Lachnospiraceae bacterium]